MDSRVPDENVADLHKALVKEANSVSRQRASSSSSGNTEPSTCMQRSVSEQTFQDNEHAARLKTPGGFRRGFLIERATDKGIPPRARPEAWQQSLLERVQPLIRAGYFESVLGISLDPDTGEEQPLSEGQCSSAQTLIAIVKSFVGSGVTFLPNAFGKGGWVFSSVALLVVAGANLLCIKLLLDCRRHVASSSYAEIASSAAGKWGKLAVQSSLVLSQFGVCIAFLIFISELAQSMGFSYGPLAIIAELAIVIPLCLVRSVRNLETPNLLADALIMFGLGVVLYYDVRSLVRHGITDSVETFRPRTCGVTIGTLIYVFEGIPMVLPIRNAMHQPDDFWPLFACVFFAITLFFLTFGLFCYGRLGPNAETVVLLNLPDDLLSSSVQIGYMLALLLSLPLMFLPAARITELWVFGITRKDRDTTGRSMMRVMQACAFVGAAVVWGKHFEQVLALIGALCAAPVAFIYPAVFHLKLCAQSPFAKLLDLTLAVFGVSLIVATLKFL